MITKLFEFNIAELRKNKEIDDFLRKVKSENPEEYARFVSLVGNKGLEIAKQKYEPYDPEYKKLMKQKEKEKEARRKREKTKEFRDQRDSEIITKLEPTINEIEGILLDSPLKTLLYDIKKDNKLNDFLFNQLRCKEKYSNEFKGWLKKPVNLERELKLNLSIDSLTIQSYLVGSIWFEEEQSPKNVINVKQHYKSGIYFKGDLMKEFNKERELRYSVEFGIPEDDFYGAFLKMDKGREKEYIEERNSAIRKLSAFLITKEELYKKIFEDFVYLISQEHYEEWKFKKNVADYNI